MDNRSRFCRTRNNIPAVGFFIFSIISLAFLLIGYAHADEFKKINNRYIIKLNENLIKSNQELFIENKFNQLLELTDQIDIKIAKIIDNLYTVELSTDLDIYLDRGLNSKFKSILEDKDPNINYLVKDRTGYFKPPAPVTDLSKLLPDVPIKLNHATQWNLFNAPAGITLSSKPFSQDGGWSYWYNLLNLNLAGKLVVAAVLDTGIEYNNNLVNSITTRPDGEITNNFFGWNFSANNADLSDQTASYHGTHVAGIIAAHGNNIYGVASGPMSSKPNVKILPVKIPDASGLFYESNVLKAIYWSIGKKINNVPKNPYPAKVLNMSFGIDEYEGKETEFCSPAVQEAIDYAISKNVTIVVAAGNNDAENDLGSPGGCNGVLRVAATGPKGFRASYSNYGKGIDLAAPGGDNTNGIKGSILSTVKAGEGYRDSGFDFFDGTSMAAPHVVGLIALIHAVNNNSKIITNDDMKNLLLNTTHDFGVSNDEDKSCYGKKSCGHGIIDSKNAIEAFVAQYDILFSSPAVDLFKVIPKNFNISSDEGVWELDQSTVT